jgi:radical SAM protein with 4Fe4S-binding SPASM domain
MCELSYIPKEQPIYLDLKRYIYCAEYLFPKTYQLVLSCSYEPLMNKRFFKYLDVAGTYGIPKIAITTNGILLTKSVAMQLVKSNLTHLYISIDGASKETYETIRLGAKLDTFIKNLECLIDLKNQLGSKTPTIRFQYVLLPENLHEVNKIIPLLAQFKPDKFLFIHKNFKKPTQINYKNEIRAVLVDALKECVKYNIGFREVPISCVTLEEILNAYGKENTKSPQLVNCCLDPWNFMIIKPNGDVLPCPHISVSAGNIVNNDIDKVWNNDVYQTLRAAWNNKKPPDMCKDCPYYNTGQAQMVCASEQLDALTGF